MPNLDTNILRLELCIFCVLLFTIVSVIIDLFDIFSNGLSINNNRNKVYMFVVILIGAVLAFEGYKKYGFSHCIPIFGLFIIFCAFSDLFILAILDFNKNESDYIELIKPLGYLIVPTSFILYFFLLICCN